MKKYNIRIFFNKIQADLDLKGKISEIHESNEEVLMKNMVDRSSEVGFVISREELEQVKLVMDINI